MDTALTTESYHLQSLKFDCIRLYKLSLHAYYVISHDGSSVTNSTSILLTNFFWLQMYHKFNKTQSLHKDQSVFLIKSEVTSVMVDNLTIYKQILSESYAIYNYRYVGGVTYSQLDAWKCSPDRISIEYTPTI